MANEPLDYDDDDFYARRPELWDKVMTTARLLTWAIVLSALVLLAAVSVAQAQEGDAPPLPAPTLNLPSVPIPPERQSCDVELYGTTYPAYIIDAISMQQSFGWKEQMLKNALPRPCADCVSIEYKITGMVNGTVAPQSPSMIPPYLSGWVRKDARFVVLKIDGVDQYNITPTLNNVPIIQQWQWIIPEKYRDGKEHSVCTRVYTRHASYPKITTLVDVGPLDNAKCPGGVAQFKFK